MSKDKDKVLFQDRTAVKHAAGVDGEVALELSEALIKFVETNKRFPSAIELNFKGSVDAKAVFPVTVLVGAMA
jgi:hypothetical protein